MQLLNPATLTPQNLVYSPRKTPSLFILFIYVHGDKARKAEERNKKIQKRKWGNGEKKTELLPREVFFSVAGNEVTDSDTDGAWMCVSPEFLFQLFGGELKWK